MKRLVVLIMMLTICLGICACNKNTEPAKGSNSAGAILHGLHDIKITLMFLNDKNHDNAFLIIQDGIITYDVLAN